MDAQNNRTHSYTQVFHCREDFEHAIAQAHGLTGVRDVTHTTYHPGAPVTITLHIAD